MAAAPTRRGPEFRLGFGVVRVPVPRAVSDLRAGAALLGGRHLDQAEPRLSGDPAGLVPGRADHRALHGRAVRLSRPRRADQQPDRRERDHGALGAARHAHGLQPRPLQHRRAAPLVLGAVAALPAADRDRPAGVPALSRLGSVRHADRPDPRLHRHHPAGLGLDDVRLLPPAAEGDGGGGAGRRLHALAARSGGSPCRWPRPGIVAAAVFAFIFVLDRVLLRAQS